VKRLLTADYIVGFADGEGSFGIHIYNLSREANRKNRNRVRFNHCLGVVPLFSIGNTNRQVLEEIREFFGFGTLYDYTPTKLTRHDCYKYEVNTLNGALKIMEFFKKHPPRIKKEAFEKWAEGVTILAGAPRSAKNRLRLTKELILKIAKLREQINPSRHCIKWRYEKIANLLADAS